MIPVDHGTHKNDVIRVARAYSGAWVGHVEHPGIKSRVQTNLAEVIYLILFIYLFIILINWQSAATTQSSI